MMEFDKDTLAGAQAAFSIAARMVQLEPSEEWVRTCIDENLFEESPFGMDDAAVVDGLAKLSAWCEASRENVAEATGDVQREWLRLFMGLGEPLAPVWEAVYTETNGSMRGRCTLEVRSAYRTWGLEYENKAHEPEDALGLMLAFCAHLMEQELIGLEAGCENASGRAAKALEEFMVKHMLPWASAWRFLVQEHAKTDYYRGVGEFVFGLERAYVRRFGIECNTEDGTFSYVKQA
ncbi:MAG: molecular chaperone TorD family protein [Eggerthellaceae bacterium]|nr:molecular chaperone TorD family protein [Eggerthellaceae bacterium]